MGELSALMESVDVTRIKEVEINIRTPKIFQQSKNTFNALHLQHLTERRGTARAVLASARRVPEI